MFYINYTIFIQLSEIIFLQLFQSLVPFNHIFSFSFLVRQEWLMYKILIQVVHRSRLQKALDSYQEEDLALLREKWSDALMRRRQYLDQQINRIINKQGETPLQAHYYVFHLWFLGWVFVCRFFKGEDLWRIF